MDAPKIDRSPLIGSFSAAWDRLRIYFLLADHLQLQKLSKQLGRDTTSHSVSAYIYSWLASIDLCSFSQFNFDFYLTMTFRLFLKVPLQLSIG